MEDVQAWERWRRVLADEPLPAAVVDLDALDHNLDVILERLGDAPPTLRVASKSVRVPAVLRYLLDRAGARFRGLMTYSARETAFLAEQGFDDFLLAYPIGRADEARVLAELAASGAEVVVTLDHAAHVDLLEDAARAAGAVLPVCVDVDVSWRPLGGRAHFGVRRSPIRGPDSARRLGRRIREAPHLELRAILAYEAQVAGLREHNPDSRVLDPIRRMIKARSRPLAAERRRVVLEALRADGHDIVLVNGGGTGSLASTTRDPSVTEVTAGSGFLCSHLFDGYDGLPFQPAALFALGVVRASDPDHVTCAGGGYVASGAAGPDRLPAPHLPPGLEGVPVEGFGEVQTPFRLNPDAPSLAIGDPVLCRHAKAGELAERFTEYLLVRGATLVERARTYRGHGRCFM